MRGIRLFYSIKWENKNTLYYRLNLFMMMVVLSIFLSYLVKRTVLWNVSLWLRLKRNLKNYKLLRILHVDDVIINNGITKPATVDRDNSSMELLMRLKHVMNVIVFQIYKIYTIIPK
ncbi:hypothetical protein RCL_jg17017.t2 [Rhizophagus clarus]|uniref:Uncharacterized protein n=1 Tax=Rhizophagus clarus TaxID=94130 RepID=A0A8H3LIB1_9GLOM|nr:hypothetical protein RCL_jg17017.t2 [Rhizophagus clarus]